MEVADEEASHIAEVVADDIALIVVGTTTTTTISVEIVASMLVIIVAAEEVVAVKVLTDAVAQEEVDAFWKNFVYHMSHSTIYLSHVPFSTLFKPRGTKWHHVAPRGTYR